jgi:hypothetical protein
VDEATVDAVVLALATTGNRTIVRPADPGDVGARIAHSNAHERLDFVAAYRKFRYAFPDRPSPLLDGLDAAERSLLDERLRGLPTFRLEHPHPPRLDEIHRALAPVLAGLDVATRPNG